MTMVPYTDTSTLSEALLVISGDSCFVTAVSGRRHIVPNGTKVHGSPHTLIESRPFNCMVSASSYGWKRSPTTRAVRDVVQFTSSNLRCIWETDIGWKVHSMAEWSFRRTPDAAPHVWIAVATGRATRFDEVAASRSKNGRIYLLRPTAMSGRCDIQASQIKQYDSPVTAIATYSDTDIVACSSSKVYFLHYDTETSRCVLCMFMSWVAQLNVYLDSRKHAILSCIARVFALRQHRRTYTSRPNVTRHSRFN